MTAHMSDRAERALAQCTACGELLILTDHDRVERPADVWWDR